MKNNCVVFEQYKLLLILLLIINMSTNTDAKPKTPGAVIAIIVIAIIVIILFIISLIIIFTTANDVIGSAQDTLRAAGALIALSIPFTIVAFVLGARWISAKSQGKKSATYGWSFVIFAVLASILLMIGTIIGFTTDIVSDDKKSSIQAASALALIGFVGIVVIFFITVFFRRATLPSAERDKRTKQFVGDKRYEQYRSARGYPIT